MQSFLYVLNTYIAVVEIVGTQPMIFVSEKESILWKV